MINKKINKYSIRKQTAYKQFAFKYCIYTFRLPDMSASYNKVSRRK